MKSEFRKSILSAIFVMTAAYLIRLGIAGGEIATVFNKAVNICMECIGIG